MVDPFLSFMNSLVRNIWKIQGENMVILWSSTTKPWKHNVELRFTGSFLPFFPVHETSSFFEKRNTKKCLQGRTIWICLVCILFVSRTGTKVWTLAGEMWAMACLMHVLASCTKWNHLVKLSRPIFFPAIFDEQEKL